MLNSQQNPEPSRNDDHTRKTLPHAAFRMYAAGHGASDRDRIFEPPTPDQFLPPAEPRDSTARSKPGLPGRQVSRDTRSAEVSMAA
jgi:hypothetical protein